MQQPYTKPAGHIFYNAFHEESHVKQIQDIMRQMGIVQPSKHMERIQSGENSAVRVRWPIGIDKRAADLKVLAANFIVLPDPDPYASVFIISIIRD